MANWSDLKAAVASIVKTNGNKEITGQLLQDVLNNIISNVGANSTFAGIATPTTNPGTPDGNVFYITTTAGTYSNFNGITIEVGESVVLEWKGTWVKKELGFVTKENIALFENEVKETLAGVKNTIGSFVFDEENSELVYSVSRDGYVNNRYIGYGGNDRFTGFITAPSGATGTYAISKFIPIERDTWYFINTSNNDMASQSILFCNNPSLSLTKNDKYVDTILKGDRLYDYTEGFTFNKPFKTPSTLNYMVFTVSFNSAIDTDMKLYKIKESHLHYGEDRETRGVTAFSKQEIVKNGLFKSDFDIYPKITESSHVLWNTESTNIITEGRYLTLPVDYVGKHSSNGIGTITGDNYAIASINVVENMVYKFFNMPGNPNYIVMFTDVNDIVISVLYAGRTSWSRDSIIIPPPGAKRMIFTVKFENTYDEIKNFNLRVWDGISYERQENVNRGVHQLSDIRLVNYIHRDSLLESTRMRDFTTEGSHNVLYDNSNGNAEYIDRRFVAFSGNQVTGSGLEDGWQSTPLIKVTPGAYIKIDGAYSAKELYSKAVGFYTEGSFEKPRGGIIYQQEYELDGMQYIFNNTFEFQVPLEVNYIHITLKTANEISRIPIVVKEYNSSANMMLAGTKRYIGQIKYKCKPQQKSAEEKYDLSHLKWAAIGDSVTWLNDNPQGEDKNTYGYQNVVKRYINFKGVYNYGYNGGTLIKFDNYAHPFSSFGSFEVCDIYTIMFGINNMVKTYSQIGTIDDFNNNTGWNTLYGAYRMALDLIYNANPNAYIFICTEHYWNGDSEEYKGQYRAINEVAKEVCKIMHIPCIDIYDECGINSKTLSLYTYDDCHPNDKGYDRIGRLIASRMTDCIPEASNE